MTFKTTPKWVSYERQAHLVRLFVNYPDNCLLGHYLCTNPEHYRYNSESYYTVAMESKQPILNEDIETSHDENGNIILKDWSKYKLDDNGNPIYINTYTAVPVVETKQKFSRLYDKLSDTCIQNWRADDRQTDLAEWKRERYNLHTLNERTLPVRGRFSYISNVIWHESQPIYYIEGIGMNGLTLKPFAKVKLSSSYEYLYVDLGTSLRAVSKNKKRKAIRYHKPLPSSVDAVIADTVGKAVKEYLGI